VTPLLTLHWLRVERRYPTKNHPTTVFLAAQLSLFSQGAALTAPPPQAEDGELLIIRQMVAPLPFMPRLKIEK
jgi:hypothetical protein